MKVIPVYTVSPDLHCYEAQEEHRLESASYESKGMVQPPYPQMKPYLMDMYINTDEWKLSTLCVVKSAYESKKNMTDMAIYNGNERLSLNTPLTPQEILDKWRS